MRWGALGLRCGRLGALSLILFWQKFVLSNCGEVLKGLVGSEGHGLAGKVRFVELRYVAVRYVSAGAVRLGISCFVAIWCGRQGGLRCCTVG